MSNRDLSLGLRLFADSARFVAGLTQAEGKTRRFVGGVKREFESLKGAVGSLQGQLATLGVSVGAVATASQSARMDKSLTQIGQTAGMSRSEVEALRKELFRMGGDTGQSVDDLQAGFNNAVQSGLKFREALPVIDATNKAMAVTGASADQLTAGLTVAGQAFHFDLAKPQLAMTLLDKMTVAGRQGNAELQNLSDIFARVGVNAASAGMGFDQTLAFIETLSLVERQPERLATLADSTLRLFNNLNYMKEAAQATGVKFFDAKGERRDAVDILKDIKGKYDKLKTDKSRAIFLQNAFGKADLDTIKGLKTLLGGDSLNKIGEFSTEIRNAGGSIENDLPEAISNAVDQTGRLKNALRSAADDFVKPINETLTNVVKWGLDKKENGGLGLDGKDMIVGGGALAVGTLLAARYGGKAISGLVGRLGGTAAGVAEGKVLEAAAGVTPVFVVNWPASMGDGIPGLPGAPNVIKDSVAGVATGVGAAKLLKVGKVGGVAGVTAIAGDYALEKGFGEQSSVTRYGSAALNGAAIGATLGSIVPLLGTSIGAAIGGTLGVVWTGANDLSEYAKQKQGGVGEEATGAAIVKTLSVFSDGEAQRVVALSETIRQAKIGGDIRIRVDQEGRVSAVQARTDNSRIPMNVDVGYSMVAP